MIMGRCTTADIAVHSGYKGVDLCQFFKIITTGFVVNSFAVVFMNYEIE